MNEKKFATNLPVCNNSSLLLLTDIRKQELMEGKRE
jgi:hypothetical protein